MVVDRIVIIIIFLSFIYSCSGVKEDEYSRCDIKSLDKEVLYSNACGSCHSYYGNMEGAPSLLDFIKDKESSILKFNKIINERSISNIHYQFIDTLSPENAKKINCYILNTDTIEY